MDEAAHSAMRLASGALNLIFRPARREDKPRVLDFTARTWDDGDYIQDVFDEWLADSRGRFTAVELDTADAALRGQPVAIGKLTDLGEGELWLEGLRVDPAHRRQGIGAALHNYHVDLARRLGGRVLRYATGHDNVVSRMFGERTGFRHIGSYRWHEADASLGFAPPVELTADNQSALQGWLDSPLVRSANGLYPRLWKWSKLSELRLIAHFQAGQVFGLRGDPDLRAWAICELKEDWDEALLHHIDGIDTASIVEMAQAMRHHAAATGRKTIEVFALDPSPLIDALRQAGYRGEDFKMVILELPLG